MGAYSDQVLADGAVLYLRLDEPSGTTVTSKVGGYAGTVSGGVTLNQPGALADGNTAMAFDGATGKIVTVQPVPLTPPYTLEAWLRPNISNAYHNLISTRTSFVQEAILFVLSNANRITFGRHTAGAASYAEVATTTQFTNIVGLWMHLVAVCTGSVVTLFFNGIQQATGSSALAVTGSTTHTVELSHASNTWTNGSIDEVAIYPTALTPQQIQSHYALRLDVPPPPPYAAVYLPAADQPFNLWQPLTPSDSADRPFASLWVGGAGTVAAVMQNGVVGTITAPAGARVPIMGRRVNSTGTSATNILALGSV